MELTEIIAALQEFTSCDVADALVKLGVSEGGFLPDLTLWSPERQQSAAKIVGPAYTVQYQYRPDDGSPTPSVDSAPAGSVILVSCPPGMIQSCWGGLTSRRAQIRGIAGTIVDGRIRDLEELRDLEYPVFARDVGPYPPHGVAFVSEVLQTVRSLAEIEKAKTDAIIRGESMTKVSKYIS
ncbi:unnamed protein product [Clonostachys rosea]|uniref:RraA family protein n=1 Tax=Bionectria ochroleuca TaxID=29856 RepID=A0ABY6U7P3_BIOOC|nr:unnamed protein product [Clonostachys rosea]